MGDGIFFSLAGGLSCLYSAAGFMGYNGRKKDEAIAHEWENRRRESMGEKRKEFEAAFAAF